MLAAGTATGRRRTGRAIGYHPRPLMAATDTSRLDVETRETGHSRSTRRLRRSGLVPGVVYGGEGQPVHFQVDARELRHTLAHSGAVVDLVVDGGPVEPVLLKERQKHPVTGETMHVDLLRVNLNKAIQTTVSLELLGAEDAPGVKEGGVLEHVTREVTIEALPNAIPDLLTYDVSAMDINDTATLALVAAPEGVTIVDDPETTIATLTPPRLKLEDEDEIEGETGVVGEGEGEGEAAEAGESGEDAGESGGDDSGE